MEEVSGQVDRGRLEGRAVRTRRGCRVDGYKKTVEKRGDGKKGVLLNGVMLKGERLRRWLVIRRL